MDHSHLVVIASYSSSDCILNNSCQDSCRVFYLGGDYFLNSSFQDSCGIFSSGGDYFLNSPFQDRCRVFASIANCIFDSVTMAFRIRVTCYVCQKQQIPRITALLTRDNDAVLQDIAISRRSENGLPPADITPDTRVCNNCIVSMCREIQILEEDPQCMRLNVLSQTNSVSCVHEDICTLFLDWTLNRS